MLFCSFAISHWPSSIKVILIVDSNRNCKFWYIKKIQSSYLISHFLGCNCKKELRVSKVKLIESFLVNEITRLALHASDNLEREGERRERRK
jgi:hypothetical protein